MAEVCSYSYGTLWLSPGVHVCKLHSTVVVLDLTSDRYMAIGGDTLQALAALIPGWPDGSSDEHLRPPGLAREIPRNVLDLISEGVLTTDGALGRAATPLRFDSRAGSAALIPNNARHRAMRARDLVNFTWACVSTLWVLRFGSLQKAVERVARRKQTRGREAEFDVTLGHDLVAIFRRLRSFTFSAHRRCLFHALVLINFLSRYDLYPQFVMGVKIDPWAAHSWVQAGEFILDGTPEETRFFTPIFAI